jgi:uncharacterized UPF0146 family protein
MGMGHKTTVRRMLKRDSLRVIHDDDEEDEGNTTMNISKGNLTKHKFSKCAFT